jgi:hypothetical protein
MRFTNISHAVNERGQLQVGKCSGKPRSAPNGLNAVNQGRWHESNNLNRSVGLDRYNRGISAHGDWLDRSSTDRLLLLLLLA